MDERIKQLLQMIAIELESGSAAVDELGIDVFEVVKKPRGRAGILVTYTDGAVVRLSAEVA